MLAKNAIDGQLYKLEAKSKRPIHPRAVFQGINPTGEWTLFIVTGEKGERKTIMVNLNEEIQAVE